MKFKRILSAVLCVLMLTSSFVFTAGAETTPLKEVNIYLSPNGANDATGDRGLSASNPVKTLDNINKVISNGVSAGTYDANTTVIINVMGDFNNDYGAVLLYDSIPYSPTTKIPSRFYLNQIIIREMADVFARVNINVVVSNKKILLQ